ncbi:hypothetical protein Palpr_1028 [Paludibacter propionicigenes WB4]|uniref:Cell shape-determining protein n=1 Tax=Paludibacter propionicigenes (strain DSM 17365 / JCM 13257 / WB4) TaxID=694427 RepID=E4T383_PALPW|nr:hypothetical protein [Paludibacter propionicigenes]ADQ79177.1 hypothetical protein Palpr_1028 [Paludibacter propionicigenes WB4]
MKKLRDAILVLIVASILLYTVMPTINFGFTGFPIVVLILTGIWTLLNSPFKIIAGKNNAPTLKIDKPGKIPLIILVIVAVYITIVPFITSWALLRTDDYRNLIGKVETESNLSNHMLPISIEKIRVVDQSLAQLLGDKVLGSQPALGSQVTLGTFNIQKVKNDLYWVAPLLHSGFFKWQKNMEGTNGYVMVNACNERDVKLVQEIDGKKVFIKYQSEAYFFDNLERYLYFHGYWNVGLTDYSFEIDDAGIPYWVVTKYKKTIGFAGEEAQGVVIVNAQTGEINDYSIANTPKWVDRIQPGEFIETQLNNWGEYVKGYWNFSNENKLKITEPVSLVYGDDNNAYWYTGLTSVGSDESTVGFVLVNTRTKKAVWYKQSGATEYAAQNSAKGKVQEKGFSASAPIPYNINNIPTYVMTLKDNGGLVKMYAMVAIEDYTIVGVGNSLREALMAYKNAFNQSGNKISAKSKTEKNIIKSIITRINGDVKNGNTYYYFTLKNFPKIFIGSTQISNDFPVSNPGDSVYVSFDNDNQEVIDISSFKNRSIGK